MTSPDLLNTILRCMKRFLATTSTAELKNGDPQAESLDKIITNRESIIKILQFIQLKYYKSKNSNFHADQLLEVNTLWKEIQKKDAVLLEMIDHRRLEVLKEIQKASTTIMLTNRFRSRRSSEAGDSLDGKI